jgi:PAS domain S-box-containing protein
VKDSRGNIIYYDGTFEDITARKQAEEALRESESRFRAFIEQAPVAIGVFDLTGIGLYANDKFAETLGLQSAEEVVGRPAFEYFVPQFREESKERTRRRLQGLPVPAEYESIALRADGSEFPVQLAVAPIHLASGTVSIAFLIDLTERKRTEQALRESEARHRTILQTAMDGFWVVDMQGRILEVNETYCRMSGYSERELLAMTISDLEVSESPDQVAAHIQKLIAAGEDRFETRHRRRDGSVYQVESSTQYRAAEGGRVVAFLRDITARKQAEEALRESESRFRALSENSLSGIYIIEDGRLQYVNLALTRIFG